MYISFFFSSRRRHTIFSRDWSSDVCSSDLGNLLVAEATAPDVGMLDLREALELTALIAEHDRPRSQRYTVRWLVRYLNAADAPTIDEVAFIGTCLAALGGQSHAEALSVLRAMAGR